MKTFRWERISTSKPVLVIVLKVKSIRMLLSTFLRTKATAILCHCIILWCQTVTMITAKTIRSILEVQILEITNWPSKMFRARNQDSKVKIRTWSTPKIKELLTLTVLASARLGITVSLLQEILKIELIASHNWLQQVKLLSTRENRLQIQWGPTTKITKRKRLSKREMLLHLKAMVAQWRSRPYNNLQSTTFLTQKVLQVKLSLVTTHAKIINNQPLAKINAYQITWFC